MFVTAKNNKNNRDRLGMTPEDLATEIGVKQSSKSGWDMSKFLYINRLKAGLNQEQLSDCTGVSDWSISQYELGNREPKCSTLLKLIKFFSKEIQEIKAPKNIIKYDHQYVIHNKDNSITVIPRK